MGTRIFCFLLPFVLVSCRPAEKAVPASRPDVRARLAVPPEGFLEADILSALGIHRRPVLISNGRVDCVQWSDSLCMPFHGNLFADGTATGTMQNGEMVKLQLLE